MVLPALVLLAFLTLLVLVSATRFVRMFDIEERRRHGLPIDDLLKTSFAWKIGTWVLASLLASVGLGWLAVSLLGLDSGTGAWLLVSGTFWVAMVALGWYAARPPDR